MATNFNLVAIWVIVLNLVASVAIILNLVAMEARILNLVAMEARPAMMEKSIARQMNTGCHEEMSVLSRILRSEYDMIRICPP